MNDTVMPVYRQIADSLIGKIRSGEFPEGMRFPPETELASMLGIHRITLRKSLAILASRNLIVQMPHRGTFVAARPQKKIRIGIVTHMEAHSGDLYLNKLMMDLAILFARSDRFEYTFINLRGKNPDLKKCGCDALLVPYQSDELYALLDRKCFDSLPMVFINLLHSNPDGLRFAVSQEPDSILRGVEYLRKAKHRKIAFISRHNQSLNLTLITECILRQQLPEVQVYYTDAYPDRGASGMIAELCRSAARPTAILLPGQGFVMDTLLGIAQAGLRVPEDISLLASDPPYQHIPLSTIEQPLTDMLQKALDILYEVCTGKTFRNHTFLFKMEVHDRGSVKRFKV